jgi:hypothetical protein
LLIVAALVFDGSRAWGTKAEPIDFILDLDWTLFYSIRDPEDPARVPRHERVVFQKNGHTEYYRISDHAVELIEALLRIPGARVSFFSGGERARNETILRAIHLSDGRTALGIASHVFSFENLTQVSNDPRLRFPDRYKKQMRGLIPDLDPKRALLIDDHPEFAMNDLKAVRVYGELNFRPMFEPTLIGSRYEALSEAHWRRERDKLAIVLGVIDRAYQLTYSTTRSHQGDFAGRAESLMRKPETGEWYTLMSPELDWALARGLAIINGMQSKTVPPTRTRVREQSHPVIPQCQTMFMK